MAAFLGIRNINLVLFKHILAPCNYSKVIWYMQTANNFTMKRIYMIYVVPYTCF